MSLLKIKHESLPVRCEICHQTDLFDPLSNTCSRCAAIVPAATANRPEIITHSYRPWQLRRKWQAAANRPEIIIHPTNTKTDPPIRITTGMQIRVVLSWVMWVVFVTGSICQVHGLASPFLFFSCLFMVIGGFLRFGAIDKIDRRNPIRLP